MAGTKADIIAQLQKDILPLQGLKSIRGDGAVDVGLGIIKQAFPNNEFPLGVIHEFINYTVEDAAVSTGFITGILSALMKNNGASIWIGATQKIFPPALQSFGIAPDKMIFINLRKEKDILWAMEEALKCEGLSAVIGEIPELSFTASRRLQLAVEQSRVTGFVIRQNPKQLNTTACVTRWKITALPSDEQKALPGVGFPRWQVELLKVRNGKPGSWPIEFKAGRFRHVQKLAALPQLKKKTG